MAKTKSLVVVESPAKATTVNKILGTDFIVKSCMGHVRDNCKVCETKVETALA